MLLRDLGIYSSKFKTQSYKFFFYLFVVIFFFKISSRVGYLDVSIFSDSTLLNENRQTGVEVTISTYFSIFFYPLAIILSFTPKPVKVARIVLTLVLITCLIDMVFIGAKNAPMFTLMFYLLTIKFKFTSARTIFLMSMLGILFIFIFSHSTIGRTAEGVLGEFDWVTLLLNTGSTEVLKINPVVLSNIVDYQWLYPVIFLSNYLTHSIAELYYLLDQFSLFQVDLAYTKDQFCAVGLCDRVQSSEYIYDLNSRHNIYATMYTTLFFDFGITLTLLFMLLGFGYIFYGYAKIKRAKENYKSISLGFAVIGVWLLLGSIENYFYNGLGLVQFLLIFALIGIRNVFSKLSIFK
jgi:hypothetical protein